MDLSIRLQKIADLIEPCESVVDVGTDHGYIPIYLVKNNICKKAIASDINKGPIERAKNNVRMKGLSGNVKCRLGAGLSTIKKNEVDVAVIAGMGGNLIRDILNDKLEVFKALKYAVVQPTQNVEVFRKYVLDSGYEILGEDICFDEGKFYQMLKIRYRKASPIEVENEIFYDISENLIKEKHPVAIEYAQHLIEKYERVCSSLNDDTENSRARKIELKKKIDSLKEVM